MTDAAGRPLHNTPEEGAYDPALRPAGPAMPATIKRISWGAIFAGAVIALVVQTALTLLGIGIGAAVLDPAEAGQQTGLGWGAAIWVVLSGIIALAAGGWVAGRLAGMPRTIDGIVHGVTTWAVVTLFSMYLIGSAVGLVVGGAAGVVGQAVGPLVQEIDPADRRLDREVAVDILAEQTGMTRQEARQRVQQWERELGELEEDAPEIAADAADATATAALVGFFAMLLGAAAAAGGGAGGVPRDLPASQSLRRE